MKIEIIRFIHQNQLKEAESLAFEHLANLQEAKSLVQKLKEFYAEITELLRNSQKIKAVQRTVQELEIGLKLAKDFVDALEKELPVHEIGASSEQSLIKDKVQHLLEKNQKMEAIKVLHQEMGLSLMESKNYVDNFVNNSLTSTSELNEEDNTLKNKIRALVQKNELIPAIKLAHQEMGLGLKEAKDYVYQFRK